MFHIPCLIILKEKKRNHWNLLSAVRCLKQEQGYLFVLIAIEFD